MAIRLDVQPYCENCPGFEADVDKNKLEMLSDFKVADVIHETTVRCKRRKTCEGIKRYLEKEMQRGD